MLHVVAIHSSREALQAGKRTSQFLFGRRTRQRRGTAGISIYRTAQSPEGDLVGGWELDRPPPMPHKQIGAGSKLPRQTSDSSSVLQAQAPSKLFQRRRAISNSFPFS